jgi:hypothetical protein
MGVDLSVFEFKPEEGLEDFPNGVDAVMRNILGISEEESAAARKRMK